MATQIKKQKFREYKVKFEDERIIPLHLLHFRVQDSSGDRYGKLILKGVIKETDKHGWLALCDCGKETFIAGKSRLTSKNVQSCGCLAKESAKTRKRRSDNRKGVRTTHGLTNTKTYGNWSAMVTRCHNKNSPSYLKYGLKGISVCDRWYNPENVGQSYLNFLEDMGERPFFNAQIDRLDNSLGYFKDNCRWTSPLQNARNQKRTLSVDYGGVSLTLVEWAEKTGIAYNTLKARFRDGLTGENLFRKPRKYTRISSVSTVYKRNT